MQSVQVSLSRSQYDTLDLTSMRSRHARLLVDSQFTENKRCLFSMGCRLYQNGAKQPYL